MKKIIILLLCFIVVFVLSACSYNVIYNSDNTQQLEQPEQNVEPNIKSEIIETDITPATFGKHYSLFVEFEDSEIDLESVKKEIIKIIEENKRTNTVLWIYASTSHRNTIMDNWITYAIYVPKELSEYNEWYSDDEADENGVYWVDNSMMKELETSYVDKFDTDENVLQSGINVLNKTITMYNLLNKNMTTSEDFLKSVETHKEDILAIDNEAVSIKLSENNEVNEFIACCINTTSYLRVITELLEYEQDDLVWRINNTMHNLSNEIKKAQDKYFEYND